MEIREFGCLEDKEYWLSKINKSDWEAGQYLHELLSKNELTSLCGKTTKVFLLIDNQQLISFCTLAEEDDVRDTGLTPWIGFVYTFPEYRGHRYMGLLLDFAYETARNNGAKYIYISTDKIGLYEKYRYSFYQMMKDMNGEVSRVYRISVK